MTFPYISTLFIILIASIAFIWILPKTRHAKVITFLAGVVSLIFSSFMVQQFDASSGDMQFIEHYNWIPGLNAFYSVGVDGLSILFLPLTSLLFVAATATSWTRIHYLPRFYYSLILITHITILGIYTALDTLLFMLFWELALVPMYFLIALWGKGPTRRYAATKYTLFMLVGGIPLLFGFILLATTGADSDTLNFSYTRLLSNPPSLHMQTMIFFLLLTGFAFKTPLFPFHTWLPLVAMEGPIAIGAIITGIKIGAFGILRYLIPLAPDAAIHYHWLLAGLGVIGIIYGALMALQQTNLRSMLAYSSISHIGLVVLALSSMDIQGLEGAVFQLLNFTVISSALFMLTGFLHARTGSTEIITLGGIVNTMPVLTAFFWLFGFASIGIPGGSGFPAELMMLISSLRVHTGAGLAALFGVVLSAGFFVKIYRRCFLGPATTQQVLGAEDLLPREKWIVVILAILVVIAGVFPSLVFQFTQTSAEAWIEHLGK